MREAQRTGWFQTFLTPRSIIFGICLINALVTYARAVQREFEIQASGFSISGDHPVMLEPLLLLVAAILLLVNRWWSTLLATFASLRVIYLLGYLSWTAVHFAHGVQMLSWQALEKLWYVVYEPRPQYLFELGLGVVIFTYALVLLRRSLHARSAIHLPAANEALQRALGWTPQRAGIAAEYGSQGQVSIHRDSVISFYF